jgi:hypothetical protein
MKLAVVGSLWAQAHTALPAQVLAGSPSESLLTWLMKKETELVWETDTPHDACTEWANLCAEVIVRTGAAGCSSSLPLLRMFWGTPGASQRWAWNWTMDVRRALASLACIYGAVENAWEGMGRGSRTPQCAIRVHPPSRFPPSMCANGPACTCMIATGMDGRWVLKISTHGMQLSRFALRAYLTTVQTPRGCLTISRGPSRARTPRLALLRHVRQSSCSATLRCLATRVAWLRERHAYQHVPTRATQQSRFNVAHSHRYEDRGHVPRQQAVRSRGLSAGGSECVDRGPVPSVLCGGIRVRCERFYSGFSLFL